MEDKRKQPMSTVPDKAMFESMYAGGAPWDIGKPQPALIGAADKITGNILDAGCGTGDSSLFFASRGNTVTGIDFLEEPIKRARRKAAEQGIAVTFLVKDAVTLADLSERFDNVIDSGLFHVFTDPQRAQYVRGLAAVLKPGGRVFLMCFSNEEPGTDGPRRISRQDLHQAFADGWQVESIDPYQIEIRRGLQGFTFSEGGPKAWFAVIRRSA
jgi:SAM-dependent methyltransferase